MPPVGKPNLSIIVQKTRQFVTGNFPFQHLYLFTALLSENSATVRDYCVLLMESLLKLIKADCVPSVECLAKLVKADKKKSQIKNCGVPVE